MRTKEEQEAINKACKYHPNSTEELQKLVNDPKVDLRKIDTSKITDMSYLISFAQSSRTDFSGIENWDTSHVTDMSGMFYCCGRFNQDISSWDVSSVENMRCMFWECHQFNQDISSWDVSNVKDMRLMFYLCLNFNQDIGSWNVAKVSNMKCMFADCKKFNQDISKWDTSNVKDMSGLFGDCKSFNQNLNDWVIRENCNCSNSFKGSNLSLENVKEAFTKEQLLNCGSEKIIDALNNEKKQVKVQEQKVTKGRGR